MQEHGVDGKETLFFKWLQGGGMSRDGGKRNRETRRFMEVAQTPPRCPQKRPHLRHREP